MNLPADAQYFATVPKGMESLLAGELRTLGARELRQAPAGVAFTGDLETAYRLCLWSRLASRVLLQLTTGPAANADQLYATAQSVAWDEHLGADGTLAVTFTGVSDTIRDTRFGALRVKDAIVDQFRTRHAGRRPSVDTEEPELRVSAHLARGRVALGIDLSGESLHRRGYRTDKVQVEAPLKENLAAAVLLFAGWPREAASGGSFLDPLCGSGTLPVEAALIAADVAPGLLRAARAGGFGFLRWRGHDEALWQRLAGEARRRRDAGLQRLRDGATVIRGSDRDESALRVARSCAERAGVQDVVGFAAADLAHVRAPAARGLVATNAPYGERLGAHEEAEALLRMLGRRLHEEFPGWHAAVLAGQRRHLAALAMTAARETTLYNGALPCALGFYRVEGVPGAAAARSARAAVRSSARTLRAATGAAENPAAAAEGPPPAPMPASGAAPAFGPARLLSGGAEQLANRLRKNHQRLARQLRREDLTCYRLYDADLPEYNMVVDVYGNRVHVQEYAAPPEVDPAKAERRLTEGLAVIAAVLEVPSDHIVLKQRRRQRGAAQYERRAAEKALQHVSEDGLTYLVNLTDYLDTGLFLDQRLTRRLVRSLAGGRRFLNLFAYTGTMTVNALAGGAPQSVSVDLSSTYLDWARRNLEANGFAATVELTGNPAMTAAHRLIQADCLRWLAEAQGTYDLIWLDPPTFSNSKRMGRATFDVQRDHADLIRLTARRLLAPGGTLLFATNRRGFRFEARELGGLHVQDISRATLPFDCERAAGRHHVFRLERRG